jgi:hypothetical protein
MRASSRWLTVLALVLAAAPAAGASSRKYRVKIDSQPQQAAIYVGTKEAGIQGYTPTTLRLPRGDHNIILELPGFKRVEKPVKVTRSQAFLFTLEREAQQATIEVRSVANESATGAQLFVDGAMLGSVPGSVQVPAGRHLVEVRKAGFKDFRETVEVREGESRTMVIELTGEKKKGGILITADVAGAEVFVDGEKKDAAPTLVSDLVEGPHTVEVRKEGLPPFRQVVTVVGGERVKIEAVLNQRAPTGTLRIITHTPGAQVSVDGEPKGPANQELADLRPGQHVVDITAEGYEPQALDVTIVAGEQRIARVELKPAQTQKDNARLRVVTPVPDAEVFIDGASVGKAPVDRSDLAPGKHYVVVRKEGYAEWKREVDLNPASPTTLTAELSASGSVKILSNVAGAEVIIDGQIVGKTPVTLDALAAGEHLLEVRKSGYVSAKQTIRVEGGDQKILSADLQEVQSGPTTADVVRTHRSTSSFSAVTVEPAKFTVDLGGGFFPFGLVRLTVGAGRWRHNLGLDVGVGVRTIGIVTEGGAHAKFQFLRAGPAAMGVNLALGGGGGPDGRNNFFFEFGTPFTLLFGELVRFTAHPYLQVYTDRNCPDMAEPVEPAGKRRDTCANTTMQLDPFSGNQQSVFERYSGVRLMLRGALEIAVHQIATLWFIFEADPIAKRASYMTYFSGFVFNDPQVYGSMGVTFKY